MNIGIIGQGFVGNAVYKKFSNFFDVLTYDLNSSLCNSNFDKVVKSCNLIFTCLPTPMDVDGSCSLKIIDETLKKIDSLNRKIIIINKSTVIPGSTDSFNKKFNNLDVIFNPEFLTERNAVNDYKNQNRIILGGPRTSISTVEPLFNKVFPNAQIIKTGSKHAEMVKYFTNCFLACKVSFANEMFSLCSRLELDYDKVLEYALLDNRIGKSHLNVPGPDGDLGYGGHCFPKDLSAIIHLTEKLNSTNDLIKSIRKTNDLVRGNRDWEKMIGRAIIK